MDYKYIEQLLQRYWECETSIEEERILRSFFSQKDVPAELQHYQSLFVSEVEQQQEKLDDSFDARILSMIEDCEQQAPKARIISLRTRLRPLFRAAAIVAIVLTLGNAAQRSFNKTEQVDYNYDSYKDTYKDPTAAYEKVSSALMLVSEGMASAQQTTDSLAAEGGKEAETNKQ